MNVLQGRSVFITCRTPGGRFENNLPVARWNALVKVWRDAVRPSTWRGERRTVRGRLRNKGRLVRHDQALRTGAGRANGCTAVDRCADALTNAVQTCVFVRRAKRRESSRTFDETRRMHVPCIQSDAVLLSLVFPNGHRPIFHHPRSMHRITEPLLDIFSINLIHYYYNLRRFLTRYFRPSRTATDKEL